MLLIPVLTLTLTSLPTPEAPIPGLATEQLRPPSFEQTWQLDAATDVVDTAGYEDLLLDAARLSRIGRALAVEGNLVNAEPLLLRSMHLYERLVDPSASRAVAEVRTALAWVSSRQYRDDTAVAHCRRALATWRAVPGAPPKPVTFCTSVLAYDALSRGQEQRAEQLYRRALGIAEAQLDRNDDTVIYVLDMLATTLEHRGRLARALEIRRSVVDRLGADDNRAPGAQARLAVLLIGVGDADGAARAFEASLAAGDRVGAHSPSRGMLLAGLGLAYWLMDEPLSAVETYDEAIATLETDSSVETEHVIYVLEARAVVLDEVRRGVDAVIDRYRAEALSEGFEHLPSRAPAHCSPEETGRCS